MHRIDNSKYLLYIEPKVEEKLSTPIDDKLTQLMEMAIGKSEIGTALYSKLDDNGTFRGGPGYRGFHSTKCGMRSSNKDYKLENGMITNSLAPFYLKWYRYSIPESEMNKVIELQSFYKNKPTN